MRTMRVAASGRDLVVRYDDHVALETSDFHIPEGGITTLIGPNGSGKSTLLNVLAGIHQPSVGSVTVAADRNRIAYVLQSTKVPDALPVTVQEVVSMGRYAGTHPLRRLNAQDKTAIEDAMQRMDIEAIASRHLAELSGGQRQRVFVAQGLAQDHDLLLLDEPLTGLDLPAATAIDQVIHDEQSRGCTIVMTTHDLSEAEAADWVVLLVGRVVAFGPPAEVLTPENLQAAYGSIHQDNGRWFVDDPIHAPVTPRNTHPERHTHTEADPTTHRP